MRRVLRRPSTQLARAGERTCIITADTPVPYVRFRASSLTGPVAGRIDVLRSGGTEVVPLRDENRIDGAGLREITIVPDRDTAITVRTITDAPTSLPLVIGGTVLVIGAVLLTAWDVMGLG